AGDLQAGAEELFAATHVQIGLVQAQGFNEWSIGEKDIANVPSDPCIVFHPDGQKNALRTKPACSGRWHGAMNAALASLLGCSTNHSPVFRTATHHHRLATQLRPVALLDRCVERVHVHVQNHDSALVTVSASARDRARVPISRATSSKDRLSTCSRRRTSALPTMMPSVTSRSTRTCSGLLIPKPTQMGKSVCPRNQRSWLDNSSGRRSRS